MSKRNFTHSRGAKSFHSHVQLVQAHFGLSQQRLAYLLGVSRTAVAMEERGERSLPPAATLRFYELVKQLPQPFGPAPAPLPPAPTPVAEWDCKDLEQRLRAILIAEHPVRQELERLQTRLAQARLRLHVLPALQAAFPDERGQRWLESFAAEATSTLEYDASVPARLELRLRVLAFERAEIEQLLGKAPPADPPAA